MTMQFPPDFLETLRQPVLGEADLDTQSSFFSREEVRGFYLSVMKSPEKNEVLQLAVDQLPLLHPHRAALLALLCGALVEDGAVTIGQSRALVEMGAGQLAQPIEMRLEMAKQRVRQMDAQEIGQRRIGAVEIQSRGVGCKQSG